MRNAMKKNLKYAMPAIAAAGLSALMGAPARGDFTVSLSGPVTTNGFDVYQARAINDQTLGTTKLTSLDVTINSYGTGATGALKFEVIDVDGDGNPDANVSGKAAYDGSVSALGGGSTLGSWIRVGTAPGFTDVFTGPNALSSNTTVDPSYLNGTNHSSEVAGFNNSVTATGAGALFANIVVPTGTGGIMFAGLADEAANSNTVTVTFGPQPSTGSSGPIIQLTGSALAGTSAVGGPITMVGSNGGYLPQTVNFAGTQKGNLQVGGFNPTGDQEIYGLAATGQTSLATLISDLQAALATTNPNAVVSTVPVTGPLATVLAGDNVEITFPTGAQGSVQPGVLSFDLSSYASNGSVSLSSITVVPEPTGLGALALGGISLLSRRRRRTA